MPTETPDSGAPLAPPEDFAEYETWRNTPAVAELERQLSSEAEKTPAESTAPESETGKTPQELEAEEADDLSHKGLKKRFSKLTGKIRELESQLSTRQPAPAAAESNTGPASQAAANETPGKPQLATWEGTYEAYTEALTDWKIDQREQARSKADNERKAAEAHKTKANAWSERETAARAKYDDYDSVISDAKVPDTPARGDIHAFLIDSEIGPEVAYFLATNPDELKRIAALSPLRAVAELGKMEGSLVATPETPKPKTTSAPRPPTTVGAKTGAPSRTIHDPALLEDFGEWERVRNAQLSRR